MKKNGFCMESKDNGKFNNDIPRIKLAQNLNIILKIIY